jgi:large subunit ribosomal protein L18
MAGKVVKTGGWAKRKARVRMKVKGASERLRLNVYRSNKHIYAQLIDDTACKTVVSASTRSKGVAKDVAKLKKVDISKKVGELIGKLALEKGVKTVVFDRSGYLYHGRVKALAEGAREAGLKF